jgi:hypothetical protein
MRIHELFEQLSKKTARNRVSHSLANRARPHLEALETRLVLSDTSGGLLPPIPVDPSFPPPQIGS